MFKKFITFAVLMAIFTGCMSLNGEGDVTDDRFDDTDEVVDKTTEDSGDVELADNVMDFDTIAVGDRVGAMTVSSSEAFREDMMDFGQWNSVIGFTGEVTFTSEYKYFDSEAAFRANKVCIYVYDDEVRAKLPTTSQRAELDYSYFCIINGDEVREMLGLGEDTSGEGTATFTIDYYEYIGLESEVSDMVNVVSAK